MKKLVYLSVIFVAFGFTSCKECTTCKIVTSTYETPPEEFCGTDVEVSDFEQKYQDQALAIHNIGARAECHRK